MDAWGEVRLSSGIPQKPCIIPTWKPEVRMAQAELKGTASLAHGWDRIKNVHVLFFVGFKYP